MIVEKIWVQSVQPMNTSVLWLDTSGEKAILKMFYKGSWLPVGDETGEIAEIEEELQRLAETVGTQGEAIGTLQTDLGNKVDKVEGKVLSSNDFTDELKEKLDNIEAGAEKNTVTSVAGKTGEVTLDKSDVGLGNVTNDAQVKRTEMGAANGVATLDANGKLVASQIPEVADLLSYGVEWDTTVSNPACTRVGNPLLHKSLPIQSALKGCIATGTSIAYYLKPDDWTKKEDGTAANLDGTDGYVRVHSPKFYARSFVNGTKRQVRFSTVQIDPTWIEIPEMLIDAYRPTLDRTNGASIKLVSVINDSAYFRGGGNRDAYDAYLATDPARTDLGKPVTNMSRATARTYAANAGSELMCYEYYKWVIYWMFVIEYATFNSQAAVNNNLTPEGYHQGGLGNGMSTWNSTHWSNYNGYYPITPCGHTNSLGNFSGEVALVVPAWSYESGGETVNVPETTYYANRYRGIENPFGDVWTNLDGIIIDANCGESGRGDNLNIVYTSRDSAHFGDTITDYYHVAGHEIHTDGYIGEFDLQETGEIIPSSVDGGSTSKKCDYHYTGAKDTTLRTLAVGGNAHTGAADGLGYFYSNSSVGSSDAYFGFRSVTVIE